MKYGAGRSSGKVVKFNLLKEESKYINLQFTRKLCIEGVQRVLQRHKEERFLAFFLRWQGNDIISNYDDGTGIIGNTTRPGAA